MRPPWDRVVFEVEGERFRWGDVILAATVWGEWPEFERTVREGLACAARADREGEPFPPDRLEAAADEFRYERDLYSAEETEAWLAARDISVPKWRAFVRRTTLRRAWADELEATLAADPPTDHAVTDELWVEGRCSGTFEADATRLAQLAAVAAQTGVDAPAETKPAATTDLPILDMSEEVRREIIARIDRLTRAEEALRRRVLTPDAVEEEVTRRQLEWVRIDGRYLHFPELSAAKEAELLISEDGLTIEDAAERSGTRLHKGAWYLDQVQPPLSLALIGAQAGDLVGPVDSAKGFLILQVDDRVAPSGTDPAIRERAEGRIVATAMAIAANDLVRWHDDA